MSLDVRLEPVAEPLLSESVFRSGHFDERVLALLFSLLICLSFAVLWQKQVAPQDHATTLTSDFSIINKSDENELKQLLICEILRDGGSTLCANLGRLYGQRIGQLLRLYRSPSLTSFLKQYPELFVVESRGNQALVKVSDNWHQHCPAHEVRLADWAAAASAAKQLESSSVWALRKQTLRIFRQKQRANATQVKLGSNHIPPMSVKQLFRNVKNEVHILLRLCCAWRPVGHRPFSKEWHKGALLFFRWFLQQRPEVFSVVLLSGGVNDTDDFAAISSDDCNVLLTEAKTANGTERIQELVEFSPKELQDIHDLLMLALMHDGSLPFCEFGVALRRCPRIKVVLKGRSILDALQYDALKIAFESYHVGTALCLRLRPSFTREYFEKRNYGGALMQTDEEGWYSMTDHSEANAMALELAKSFEECTGKAASAHGSCCVDMTAGVGGLTIALARMFNTVQAYEINKTRYVLLEANLRKSGAAAKTHSYCEDSLSVLLCTNRSKHNACHTDGRGANDNFTSSLTETDNRFGHRLTTKDDGQHRTIGATLPAAILDPPWGGMYYKRGMRMGMNFTLSGMDLTDVVIRLIGRVCILGIKLPSSLNITSFVNSLTSFGIERLTLKRIRGLKFLCLTLAS